MVTNSIECCAIHLRLKYGTRSDWNLSTSLTTLHYLWLGNLLINDALRFAQRKQQTFFSVNDPVRNCDELAVILRGSCRTHLFKDTKYLNRYCNPGRQNTCHEAINSKFNVTQRIRKNNLPFTSTELNWFLFVLKAESFQSGVLSSFA